MAARRLTLQPEAYVPRQDVWAEQQRTVRDSEDALRHALLNTTETDPWMRSYLHDWGAAVKSYDMSQVPDGIRGASPALDDRLGDTAFSFRDPIPITKPLERPPRQFTRHKPRTIRDILTPAALREIARWFREYRAELERFADFEWPPGMDDPAEREEFIKHIRQFNETLVLGQDAFLPEAQGIVWDVRDVNNIVPLDYGSEINTHFDVAYLGELLGGCRDRDMVSQVCETGANFGADVAMQIVLQPHLTTLAPGYTRVDTELKRLEGEGYLEFVEWLGFLPCRFIQQGTRARKLEPDRPRRISDAGGPHLLLVCKLGIVVVPLNNAIRDIPDSENPADDTYQFGNDRMSTTGCLGSASIPVPSDSTRRRARLPWESKPHVPDVLHDTMVIMYMAAVFKLRIHVIGDDWKDMFNQFVLAPWELWKVGFAFLRLGAPRALGVILEYTLGYGYANASNLCQRFANGVFDALSANMHAADVDFFSDVRRTPAERRLIARRRVVSGITGREECALFAAHVYTDDSFVIVAGTDRAVRWVRTWGEFVRRSKSRMAIPEKRLVGAGGVWCGVAVLPCIGVAHTERVKTVRACTTLVRIADRDPTLPWGDYRSLTGLLEHLLPIVGMNRRYMHELYHIHRVFSKATPATLVGSHISEGASNRATEWYDALSSCPGVLADVVFGAARIDVPTDVSKWYIFGDAARERALDGSGLGGYMHGYAWRAALTPPDIAGEYKLPITLLEYIVIGVNLIMFCPLIPLSSCNWPIFGTDSLGSFQAILDLRSKSQSMQYVTNRIADLPELARFGSRATIAQVYGTGNVFADAESRGNDALVTALIRALRVSYVKLPLSPRASQFISDVRERHHVVVNKARALAGVAEETVRHSRPPRGNVKRTRALSAEERGATAGHSECTLGDGPALDYDSDDPPAFTPFSAVPPTPPRPVSAGPPTSATPPAPLPGPRHVDMGARLVMPAHDESPGPELRGSPQPPARFRPAESARRLVPPRPVSKPPADTAPRSRLAQRRDMGDFDPTMAPTMAALRHEIDTDQSEYSIAGITDDLMVDVFNTYADSAATRTIGADRSAWKKWKDFLARSRIRKVWRNDTAANSGADPVGHRREVFLLRAFFVDTHRNMKPRRTSKHKRARPSSALNVVAGVRRIHARAQITMVSCAHLGMALRGLNSQYIAAEGSNAALLADRAEPLSNAEAAAMTADALDGRSLRGWRVDWSSHAGVSFKAALRAGRQAGFRKADIVSLETERQPHEMAKDNLSWYLDDGRGVGTYRHVAELPPAHVLVENECAVMRPAASKADPTAEHFGNQPIYLPVVRGDVNNAASALAVLERTDVVTGAARKTAPLFVADAAGTPLTCGDVDRMFGALAFAALPAAAARRRSFHSCRVFAASCHKAHDEPDEMIQALVRWRTSASLKIYARINPRDYAARVRRMSQTDVDSTISAHLPSICDSDLHANIGPVVATLASGVDIADSCDVYDSDDDDDETAPPEEQICGASSSPVVDRGSSRRAAGAPPRKRRAVDDFGIAIQPANPKRPGSKSHARYESYKGATSRAQFSALGGSAADYAHDLVKGYITLLSS